MPITPDSMFGKPVETTLSLVILFRKVLIFHAVVANVRLIMNDLGSEDGFLENCAECFIGKKGHH